MTVPSLEEAVERLAAAGVDAPRDEARQAFAAREVSKSERPCVCMAVRASASLKERELNDDQASASLMALIGRARTDLLAAFAGNVIGCFVKGLIP